jgi:hypothetical protein
MKVVARIKVLTNGIGTDAVLECVGTQESMMQAIRSARPGGWVGYVVPARRRARWPGAGHPAPVRRFLPELIHQASCDGMSADESGHAERLYSAPSCSPSLAPRFCG